MSNQSSASEPVSAPEQGASISAQASQEAARLGRAYQSASNVNIIVDSCADFNPGVARALGVEIVEFTYVMGGEEHADDLWRSMTPKEFYDRMRAGEQPTTSAVTPGRYLEVFERAAEAGTPTVYLGFTRALSSSVDAARQAADMVRESHPDFEIYVVDNLCPSAAAELLTLEAVGQAAKGLTAKELAAWVEEARYFVHGYFTLDSFDALARGGRIPPAAATVGGKLDIKPELSYDTTGALTLRGMCRGRKKALRAILADFRETYLGAEDGGQKLPIAIVSADAEKDARWLEEQVRKEPGCADVPVIHSSVGPVIGAHVGPGMVALLFWGRDRREELSFTDRIARRVKGEG